MNIFQKYTIKTLKKNKTRTIVTIIGIILSAAMITAVASLITSVQNYLVQTTISNNGSWHGTVYHASKDQLDQLYLKDNVTKVGIGSEIGYSPLETVRYESKPYLYVQGFNQEFLTMMPIDLKKGRLPENSNELLIPYHLLRLGEIKYELGDIVTLPLGTRTHGEETLSQNNPYMTKDEGGEELNITGEKTYTIVGFYEQPRFENYSSPGYTALTIPSDETEYSTLYIQMETPKEIYPLIQDLFFQNGSEYNYDLLRLTGSSDENSYNTVLYSLGTILILIIMFASIALIYNAFSISISERTKQFGLLKSIGATKRQLKKSVLFEAFVLSLIGVPIGIACGLLGIGITLKLTKNMMTASLGSLISGGDVPLTLSYHWGTILVALLVGVITVLISAYIPVKRAMKVSAIEGIRQTSDINIKSSKVKTSKITYQLFGLEGMIARKNFKRNRKRYRSTIVSLFVSVVIFISASSFCNYLQRGVGDIYDRLNYDLRYYASDEVAAEQMEELFNTLSNNSFVTDGNIFFERYYNSEISLSDLNEDFRNYLSQGVVSNTQEKYQSSAILTFIADDQYKEYLQKNNLNIDTFLNPEKPTALAIDYRRLYNEKEEKYYTFSMLSESMKELTIMERKQFEGYSLDYTQNDENGNINYVYVNEETGKEMILSNEDAFTSKTLAIGGVTQTEPLGVVTGENLILLYPQSAYEKLTGDSFSNYYSNFYFKTTNHQKAYEAMQKTLNELGLNADYLYDAAAEFENRRSVVSMVEVFSYGFIVLISFISIANVFNTISTNINLRRREFAMLKSVGMSKKSFYKMMNYECLMYGIKALLLGLPVSILVTFAIYRSIQTGLNVAFTLPFSSIFISIISVFFIVFLTMFYSMQKIKKENTIDALKNENT